MGVKSNVSNNKDFDVSMCCMPSSLYTPLIIYNLWPKSKCMGYKYHYGLCYDYVTINYDNVHKFNKFFLQSIMFGHAHY